VTDVELGQFYREYVERVVNQHDMSAVDEMVSPNYMGAGHGWPETIEALREFYRRQSRTRPDWRIDIQQTVAVGEWVAVRAFAGGQEAYNEDGSRQSPPFPTSVEWLSTIRVVEAKIAEIRIVSWVDHTPS
jgi:predicted SnoaL-like aldol condensation-catalyzing enzyme